MIKGEADVSDNYRYRVVSRVRTKIENVGEDVGILAENRDDLLEELREVVCEGGSDSREPVFQVEYTCNQYIARGSI
jgi:hypothetical protein